MSGAREKLPKVADSHIQCADAENALLQVIRKPLFIPRKQEEDYGVDFLAEALTDDREATNWPLAIQLRSQSPPRFVEEGAAISVGFRTSALNYLFRWPGRSIVVAYDAVGKQLYWQWTDEVVAALDANSRAWREQTEVAVRVPTRNVLSADAADAIRREVLAYHQRAAAMREEMLVAGLETAATAASLAGAADVLAAIRDGGPALVSSGLHREVLALLQGVPEADWINDTTVVLTVAFAYERVGSPLQALYYANLVSDGEAGVDDDDRALVEHIRLDARLALGQISADAYWEALQQLAQRFPKSFVAAQALLVALAAEVVHVPRHKNVGEEVRRILARARAVAASRAEQARDNARSGWVLDLLLARVEMEAADRLLLSQSARMRIAEGLGSPIPVRERVTMAKATFELMMGATTRLQTIATDARDAGASEMAAIAELTFLEAQVKRFGLFIAMGAPELDEAGHRRLLEDAGATAERLTTQFIETDNRMLAFRARRLQGEAYAMLGDEARVAAIRGDLERWCRQLGLRTDAATILGGPRPPKLDERDVARALADDNPEMLDEIEEAIMRTYGLPEERRPIVRRELEGSRLAYREKFDHCRHFAVLHDLRHTKSKVTHYARDPGKVGKCELLGHQSQIESRDVNVVINAFKRSYCEGCPSRQPFDRT